MSFIRVWPAREGRLLQRRFFEHGCACSRVCEGRFSPLRRVGRTLRPDRRALISACYGRV